MSAAADVVAALALMKHERDELARQLRHSDDKNNTLKEKLIAAHAREVEAERAMRSCGAKVGEDCRQHARGLHACSDCNAYRRVNALESDLAVERAEVARLKGEVATLRQQLRLTPPDFLGLADRLRLAQYDRVADIVLEVRDWLAAPSPPPEQPAREPRCCERDTDGDGNCDRPPPPTAERTKP